MLEGKKEEVAQTMYIHVSECKNDKIKGERKKEGKESDKPADRP
jgi:hypothetical protein